MPLAIRTNGSSTQNIITSAWFNDIRDLLTGVMTDQTVKIQNLVISKAIGAAPAAAATAALAAGTNLGIGLYVYVYTYANADGESKISPTVNITTTSGNQKVNLSGVTVGPTGTTRRNIYRTVVGGGSVYKFVAAIADNTTTTYSDTLVDGSLGAVAPAHSTFGGALVLQDQTGAVTFSIANDGFMSPASFGNTAITGTLTVSGTSTIHDLIGSGKIGKTTAGDMFDFSGGTDVFIKGGSGKISFQISGSEKAFINSSGLQSAAGLDVTGGGADVTGSSTFHSGLTVTGGTLTTGAITASGTITANSGFNLGGGVLSLLVGSMTKIAFGFSSVTTGGTTITHSLGTIPSGIFVQVAGLNATAWVTNYAATNTMTVTVSANCNVWWLVVAP